jgi:tetratricopeptide (TPR) repeat protein
MRRLHGILIALCVLNVPVLAQTNSHGALHQALLMESRGEFEAASETVTHAINSGQLRGGELGNAYSMLAIAWQAEGHLSEAQSAFHHSLDILQPDREHTQDYAAALENCGGFYVDLGQLDLGAAMWVKAFHLRQQIADPEGLTLSLVRMTELALARQQLGEARKYLRRAMHEARIAPDLLDQDRALLAEMQGWVALTEHHDREATAAYQQALDLVENSLGPQHWLTGWEYMLRGTAYARAGNLSSAESDMQRGLRILGNALGQRNPKYFISEIAYARVLERMGSRVEAAELRSAAEKAGQEYYGGRCPGCTINIAAFR